MDVLREMEGKGVHDRIQSMFMTESSKCVCVHGPIIIGAGPSGLAVAACLKQKGIPSVILERSHCIASLWQLRTYDRLRLHLPKEFCELPLMPFPEGFPTYPTKQQFIEYLDGYAKKFEISPVFNQSVVCAEWDKVLGIWKLKTVGLKDEETCEYVCKWLIVATGENAEAVLPKIEGMEEFDGEIMHASSYKNGGDFGGKRVLVVGCGNSGMEICLDLCNYKASPTLAVRDTVRTLIN